MAIARKGLLIDVTRCIGCGACAENCKKVNELPAEVAPRLDSDTWTVVEDRGEGVYVRHLCRHCIDAACVSACPVAALRPDEHGAVLWNGDKCLGCRYCMVACPFHIPTFEWFSATPRIRKCILCAPRVDKGLSTGCAEACPTEATVFGDRETLIALAQARLAAAPERYHQEIYGLTQAGGTSVLFLSPVPFEQLGFDMTVPERPLPELTGRVMVTVLPTFGVVLGGMTLAYFLYKRREAVQAAQEAKPRSRVGKLRKEQGNG
jgi:formate dehydrogenase iron-sulfur subunit